MHMNVGDMRSAAMLHIDQSNTAHDRTTIKKAERLDQIESKFQLVMYDRH